MSTHPYFALRKSVFAIFIGLGAEITGKILKNRLILSKTIIEILRLPYLFSKTEFRVKFFTVLDHISLYFFWP